MDIKEFKEKFKLGDFITCQRWVDRGYSSEKISLISSKNFAYIDDDSGVIQVQAIGDCEWFIAPEPKEQDLADVFPAVVIYDNGTTREVTIKCVDGKTFEDYQDKNNFSCVTIEEAKERGLNLNL